METTPLRQRAILISLSISMPSGRKQDKSAAAETLQRNEAMPEHGNFSKLIYPKLALEPLKQHVTKTREYFATNTLAFSDDNRRFLPNTHFLQLTEEMVKRKEVYDTLQAVFLGNHGEYVEQMREPLGKLFNADDYPDLYTLKKKFSWEVKPEPLPSGADLRLDVSEAELQALQEGLDKRIEAAGKAAQLSLYRRLFEPLSRMVARLSDPKGRFHDTLVSNLQEVCEVIPKLSLDDDAELGLLVESARQLTLHSPGVLRDDTRVRSDVARRAQELTERMSAFFPQESATIAA